MCVFGSRQTQPLQAWWPVCQHDFTAKDDRDPSQNSAMRGRVDGVHRPGAQTGDGTIGGLDGIQLVCQTDHILYDFKPPPIQTHLEKPARGKEHNNGFSYRGDVRAWKRDPCFSRWLKLVGWRDNTVTQEQYGDTGEMEHLKETTAGRGSKEHLRLLAQQCRYIVHVNNHIF